MQLDACLRSLAMACRDVALASVHVLYAAATRTDERQYQELAANHTSVRFVNERAFSADLDAILAGCHYVLFVVDDTLFTGFWNLADAIRALSSDESLVGISLRLGRNTTWCYTYQQPQTVPPLAPAGDKLLAFAYDALTLDFGYPLEVSSSIYRGADIRALLAEQHFSNPNLLEYVLNDRKATIANRRPRLACYEQSVAFSNPINIVQTEFGNRYGREHAYSAALLRRLFDGGARVDVRHYLGTVTRSCHEERPLVFMAPPCLSASAELKLALSQTGEPSFTAAEIAEWRAPFELSIEDWHVRLLFTMLRRAVQVDTGRSWLVRFAKLVAEYWDDIVADHCAFLDDAVQRERRQTLIIEELRSYIKAKEDATQALGAEVLALVQKLRDRDAEIERLRRALCR